MANEITNTEPKTFSVSLQTELEKAKDSLPSDFNIPRFVQNSIALLNGNEVLINYAKTYRGQAQKNILAGLLRAAYLGLDALNGEAYLVPFGSNLNFMPSFKGAVKLAIRYSTRPIKEIYARIVREGDEYDEAVVNGEPTINHHPKPFSSAKIIGAFAVCLYMDGGMVYETMSIDELETTRNQSKAANSPAWRKFPTEMYKKTVLHRLCKHISIDFDAKEKAAFDAGLEIETDTAELAKREIAAGENSEDFIESDARVVM